MSTRLSAKANDGLGPEARAGASKYPSLATHQPPTLLPPLLPGQGRSRGLVSKACAGEFHIQTAYCKYTSYSFSFANPGQATSGRGL